VVPDWISGKIILTPIKVSLLLDSEMVPLIVNLLCAFRERLKKEQAIISHKKRFFIKGIFHKNK